MLSSRSNSDVRLVQVPDDRSGQRLDNFLLARLKGVPKSAIYRLIRTGQVRVNGRRSKANTRLEGGDEVRIPPVRTSTEEGPPVIDPRHLERIERRIVYEDASLLVIDKPVGMAVHGGSGLAWGLVDIVRQIRPAVAFELVHRLDRDTSGCLMLAAPGESLAHFGGQMRGNEVSKFYLCLLHGRPAQRRFVVDAPLAPDRSGSEKRMVVAEAGKPSRTGFEVLALYRAEAQTLAWCQAELFTGRTHQIRVHAAHAGHPVIGDRKYGGKSHKALGAVPRLMLHAHRLIVNGLDGAPMEFTAPPDAGMRRFLDSLGPGES